MPTQATPEDRAAEMREDANGAPHGGMPPPPPRQPREAAAEPDLDEEEEPEEENTGQWSPQPLDPEQVQGQDIIPEEEDARLLELLRAQVGAAALPEFGVHPFPHSLCNPSLLPACTQLWFSLTTGAHLREPCNVLTVHPCMDWSSKRVWLLKRASPLRGCCR